MRYSFPMSKKLSPADKDLIAAHRIGQAVRKIPIVNSIVSIFSKDEDVKNVLVGDTVIRGITKLFSPIYENKPKIKRKQRSE